jgi:hypothetical protein
MSLSCNGNVLWFFNFKTFWPNYNLDLSSYGHLLSLFLHRLRQVVFPLRSFKVTVWDVYNKKAKKSKLLQTIHNEYANKRWLANFKKVLCAKKFARSPLLIWNNDVAAWSMINYSSHFTRKEELYTLLIWNSDVIAWSMNKLLLTFHAQGGAIHFANLE